MRKRTFRLWFSSRFVKLVLFVFFLRSSLLWEHDYHSIRCSHIQIYNISDWSVMLMIEYYQDWDCSFSTRVFCQEVLLSYRLIFVSESRTRKNYRNFERQRAQRATEDLLNSSLNQYCDLNTYDTSDAIVLRVFYSHITDFSIFEARLLIIQTHVLNQHFNRIKTLWQDKRDLLRWYTLWTVIFIEIVELLLTVLQIILSALQIAIAWRFYQIQIK